MMIITRDGITEARTYGRHDRRRNRTSRMEVVGFRIQRLTMGVGGSPQLLYVNCGIWAGIGTYSLDYAILDNTSGKLGAFPSIW
jgi:hypothetical protein